MEIEGFEVLEPLGSGAMSAVWKARERASGRLVALKVLHSHAALSPGLLGRFARELEAHERLVHPNIISCLKGGRSGERWFAALEYLDGGDLRGLLRTAGRLPPQLAGYILGELLQALLHAHRLGVVHRDVKPENVMLSTAGAVKLADFGIATAADSLKLTEVGTIVGTPAYMAPEQAATGLGDARSDLWSAGVLLYEMVSGRNPFAAEHTSTVLALVARRSPAPLGYRASDLPDRLQALSQRLLARDPAQRVGAEEALALLDQVWPADGRQALGAELREFLKRPSRARLEWEAERAAERLRRAHWLLSAEPPRLPEALLEVDEALAIHADSAEARGLRDELRGRMQVKRLERGPSARVQELEREAEDNPANWLTIVNLVRVARSEGELGVAVRAYRWGRLRSPRDRFAAMQLASALGFDLASYVEGADPDELRARLKGRESAEPTSPAGVGRSLLASRPVGVALFVLLLVLLARHLVPDPASRGAAPRRRAPDVQADASEAFLAKARVCEQRGEAERALAIYERFLREYPRHARVPEAAYGRARALAALGRQQAAVDAFRELIAKHPRADVMPGARLQLAAVLEALGELDSALEALAPLRSVGDAEDRIEVTLRRARILEAKADLPAALAAYDELPAKLPSYVSARASLGRGRVLVQLGDLGARAWLESAIAESEPGTPIATEARELLARLGREALFP